MKIQNKWRANVLFGLAIVSCFLTGCHPAYEGQLCPSYVVCYNHLEEIQVSVAPKDSRCILITPHDVLPIQLYHKNSRGKDYEEYERLCRKHNDLSFNRYRVIGKNLEMDSINYNDCDFTRLQIVSDKDFDGTHPAGESLNDIVRFMSWSPIKYIESGYSVYSQYNPQKQSASFNTMMPVYFDKQMFQEENKATCYPIDKMVADLQAEDMVLLGKDASGLIALLYFEKLPEEQGEYNVSVTMTTDSGKEMKSSVQMHF